MAKGKKEEPVKLDMSFEEALRLAMKTSPSYPIRLNVGERTELKNVSGRRVEFVNIHLADVPIEYDLSGFSLQVEIENPNSEGSSPPQNFYAVKNPFKTDMHGAYFNSFSPAEVKLKDKESLFVTLNPPVGKEHLNEVTACTLNYVSHLK